MKYMSISALIMISSACVHAEEKQITANSESESGAKHYFLKYGKQYEVCRKVESLINSEPRGEEHCGIYWLNSNAKSSGFSEVSWGKVNHEKHMDTLIDHALKIYTAPKNKIYFKKREELERNIVPRWSVELYLGDVDLNNDGKRDKVFRFLPWGCRKGSPAGNIILKDDLSVEMDSKKSVIGELFKYDGRTFSFYNLPGSPVVIEPGGRGMTVEPYKYVCEFREKSDEEDSK